MRYKNLPPELLTLDQWVCVWNGSKVPMQAKKRAAASSSDPTTWSDYQTAEKMVQHGYYDHLGFVFNDNDIVGIDIDRGFEPDGFLSALSVDIMKHCCSYTEKSRSGRGIHVLVRGKLPFQGRNNRNGVEIYQSGRYFIMTGDVLVYPTIIDNQEAIDYIVKTYFPEVPAGPVVDRSVYRIYSPVFPAPHDGKIFLRPEYPPIMDGSRNISLTSLAGQLHNIGYSKADIYRELIYANQRACNPPLPEREVQSIVNSVTRYRR